MSDKKVLTLTTIEEIRTVSDPYRYKILKCFSEIDKPATVKQVADRLGEVPAKVYYHVKKLEKIGVLMLSHTEEINGIVAKYYELQATELDIKCSDDVDVAAKKLMLSESQKIVGEIFDTAKQDFLEQIDECTKVDIKSDGNVRYSGIYFTDKEYEEFNQYIEKFINDHKKISKDENEGKNKYNLFVSIYKTNE